MEDFIRALGPFPRSCADGPVSVLSTGGVSPQVAPGRDGTGPLIFRREVRA